MKFNQNSLTWLAVIVVAGLTGFTSANIGVFISDKNANGVPHESAVLELESTTRGLLPPRLTTAERNAIALPAVGLLVYNTDRYCLETCVQTEPAVWQSQTPAGTITAYGGGTIPAGWLLCNGAAINPANYPDLDAAIGTAWGNGTNDGDALTTLNLPDLRGLFLRGVDGDKGYDEEKDGRTELISGGNYGNSVGSFQIDVYKLHNHNITIANDGIHNHTGSAGGGGHEHQWGPAESSGSQVYGSGSARSAWMWYGASAKSTSGGGVHSHTLSIDNCSSHSHSASSANVGNAFETRPKNAYVNYIIKF